MHKSRADRTEHGPGATLNSLVKMNRLVMLLRYAYMELRSKECDRPWLPGHLPEGVDDMITGRGAIYGAESVYVLMNGVILRLCIWQDVE